MLIFAGLASHASLWSHSRAHICAHRHRQHHNINITGCPCHGHIFILSFFTSSLSLHLHPVHSLPHTEACKRSLADVFPSVFSPYLGRHPDFNSNGLILTPFGAICFCLPRYKNPFLFVDLRLACLCECICTLPVISMVH